MTTTPDPMNRILATILAARAGTITVVDAARDLNLNELDVRALAIRHHVTLPPPDARRRPWEPDSHHCGRIWHYVRGCGSDLCREAARRRRAQYARRGRNTPDEPTIGQRRHAVYASIGMDR